MNSPTPRPRRFVLRSLAALALVPHAARAAPGGLPSATHDESSAQWDRLREQMFPGRNILAGQGAVYLTAPLRAAYGASVPVKVVSKMPQRPELYVRKIYLVVDKNPSPVAVTLEIQTGTPNTAEVTVVHPNDTGFELNQLTVMYIPPHFVRTIEVSFAGKPVFSADMDFSVSENPTLRFNFVPQGTGELRADVTDSKESRFVGTLSI